MAKYTMEEIMYGDKYGIEMCCVCRSIQVGGAKGCAKRIREQLNTIYVKHALLVAKKMHDGRRLYFG